MLRYYLLLSGIPYPVYAMLRHSLLCSGIPYPVYVTSLWRGKFATTFTLTWSLPLDGGAALTNFDVKYRLVSSL
jgi:hypothetical protein